MLNSQIVLYKFKTRLLSSKNYQLGESKIGMISKQRRFPHIS